MSPSGHLEQRSLATRFAFPAHEVRGRGSKQFAATRHHLIYDLDTPCWLGRATLADIHAGLPADHLCHGAAQLEAHHDLAEWASWNGIDWRKVAADFPRVGMHSADDFREFAEGEGGLLILCDKHHRWKYHGIHMTDYPSWRPDRWAKDGTEFIPD